MNTALKWIFLGPVGLIILGIAVCEINKAYWDYRVDKMCQAENKVTVYEDIVLSKEDYPNIKITKAGTASITFKERATLSFPFYQAMNIDIVRSGFPKIHKYEKQIYHFGNDKLISKYVTFSRIGGDFPTGIAHGSSYSCKDHKEKNIEFYKTITVQ